jgi:transcriptional regulator with XRE-family HTH domain
MPESEPSTHLGGELRRRRQAAGLTAAQVADALGWAESTLTRKERGAIRVKEDELGRLLDHYGVDEPERAALRHLAQIESQSSTRPRDHRATGAVPAVFERFVELEELASEISIYAAMVVPGLLQTPEYADAIIAATPEPEDDLKRLRMDLRMSRQGALVRTPPPRLRVILDEAVLRRPIGGAEVMRAQMLRFIETNVRRNVSLRVLPLAVGAHPALTGPFTLLRFPGGSRPPAVFSDDLTGGVLRDDTNNVQRYQACFQALNKLTSSEEESLALFRDTADSFRELRDEERNDQPTQRSIRLAQEQL